MNIYIASDHGGFELKKFITKRLKSKGFSAIDNGPEKKDPVDDYPQTTRETILKVQADPSSKAILICRNGVGVTIFANRFKGVRAGLSWDSKHAKAHRLEDDTNILTLPADYISKQKALKIVFKWLETDFSHKDRHERRLIQIEELS